VALERATEQAAARQRLIWVAGAVGLLVVATAGVVWLSRLRRRGDGAP
jgi:hypothetical protein